MIESFQDVSVVVPAYNEEGTIGKVISELLLIKDTIPAMEIIVVDDGSSDRTSMEVSRFPSVRLIRHCRNIGKGAALKTGFRAARGRVVIIQDADLEYSPREIPRVLGPILNGDADVVYGSRLKRKPVGMSYTHFLGNVILSKASSLLYQKNITDVMTGYKAFSKQVLDSIDLKQNGFTVEVELTGQTLQNGWRFREVSINYTYRPDGLSKIRNIDGIKSLIRLFVNVLQGNGGRPNSWCNTAFITKPMLCVEKKKIVET